MPIQYLYTSPNLIPLSTFGEEWDPEGRLQKDCKDYIIDSPGKPGKGA